jgi:Cytochrome c7 and related cytochrome c
MKRWLVVVVVLAPRLAPAQVLSPGPLSHAHASIEGDDDCSKCHESGNKVVARLCLDCHKDLGGELAAGRGLHGRSYKGKPCEDCHVEHVGRNTKLIRWPGGAMEKLDHGLTGWVLDGSHAKVACLTCHTRTSPLRKPQFVATRTACAACHKDPHAGRFAAECQKCHGATSWKAFDRGQFDHRLARFPLTGKHASVVCEKCHTGAPPRWQPLAFATCDGCHADPHKGQFKPKGCTTCHDTGGWASGSEKIRDNHPRLSLANGHARVACRTCHDRGNDRAPSKGGRCESCHRPVHTAKFSGRCETCHGAIRWLGLSDAVGREHHGKTRYPLAGKHAGVACAQCHPANRPVAERYRNLAFTACNACHRDPHAGEFAARSGGECAQCHGVAGFAPTTFGVAEHARTRFALDGKHVAAPCGSCHRAARPRLAFTVAKQACADCHANPHGAQFAREIAAGGCARCHTALDWRLAKIEHVAWPLAGAHARTPCQACHGEQQKGAPATAYRGIPRGCEGCHDDVHAAQFRQTAPVKDCATCHGVESFRIAQTFGHAATRFPLEGKHTALACTACHPTAALRDGTTAVRWRLGYTRCKDCHANPHQERP